MYSHAGGHRTENVSEEPTSRLGGSVARASAAPLGTKVAENMRHSSATAATQHQPPRLIALLTVGALTLLLAGCPLIPRRPSGDTGGGEAPNALPRDLVDQLKDTVVLVEVALTFPGGKSGTSGGSGFLVSEDGLLVTNQHVVSLIVPGEAGVGSMVADDRKVQITFHPGTDQERTVPAEVVRENHEVDLALLRVDQETPWLKLADSDAAVETTKIYVCGHPLGLREFSIRAGTVTAHRVLDGQPFLEHDASGEEGSSGGPVVDSRGRVLGVHKMTLFSKALLTKMAIPSQVLKDWLASKPDDDPEPPRLGEPVVALLTAADIVYEELEGGIFALPYPDDIIVLVHTWEDFLRVFVPLGRLPGSTVADQGVVAMTALRFNYDDPVGRMSINADEGERSLYWECQLPINTATPDYLRRVSATAAAQVARWQTVMQGDDTGEPEGVYPGGDEDAQFDELEKIIQAADLIHEAGEDSYDLPYEEGATIHVGVYRGMVYTYAYTGGLPGNTPDEYGQTAIAMLMRNWHDPFGRLSLDDDDDVVWESQVPFEFITPDYLSVVAATGSALAKAFIDDYGEWPFAGETE